MRPAIFKWRQTEPELILCAVRWYLRYSLSFRDVEELLSERGLKADHTTIWRWVQCYGPELEGRLRRHLKPTNQSWRVDETYVRVKGRWCYLCDATDRQLREAGLDGNERFILWSGIVRDDRLLVRTMHCPKQTAYRLASGLCAATMRTSFIGSTCGCTRTPNGLPYRCIRTPPKPFTRIPTTPTP